MTINHRGVFYVIIIFLLTSFSLFTAQKVFSYDTDVAHPVLTAKAVDVYNSSVDINKISDQEMEWIIKGAVEEDTPIRWLNHFYDPISNKGLWGFSTAKNWATSDLNQLPYAQGDQSWQKAKELYNKGNKKEAFIALGHVVHLIEDMAVPAHARLDAHPEGDIYEVWVKNNSKKELNILSQVNFNNIGQYFDELAGYSNKYFLSSRDLLGPLDFKNSDRFIAVDDGRNFECVKGVWGQCLVVVMMELGKEKYFFEGPVNSDYYSLLAPKAVSYGAGVIDLFFKEAQKEKEADAQKTLLEKIKYSTASFFAAAWRNSAASLVIEKAPTIIENINERLSRGDVMAIEKNISTEVHENIESKILGVKITDTTTSSSNSIPQNTVSQNQTVSSTTSSSDIRVVLPADNQINTISTIQNNFASTSPQIEVIIPQPSNFFIIHAGDSIPPETNISSSLASVSSSTSASFVFSSNETADSYEYDLDGSGWYSSSGPQNFINLSDGAHVLKVRAIDKSNNTDPTPAEFSWTVDTTAPIVSIVSSPSNFASSTQAVFQFNSSESATYQCQLDSGAWQTCFASTTINSLIDGNHVLEVTGEDLVGHISSSTSYAWMVDTLAPTSSIFSLNNYYSRTGFDVSWLGSDAIASTTNISGVDNYDVQYKIAAGSWQDLAINSSSTSAVFASSVTPSDQVYFQSRARDGAGNVGDWSAVASTTVGTGHVVISEIYVNEINAGSEWIELYNPTDMDIPIAGWTIDTKTDSSADITLPTGVVIKANGFYLIGDQALGVWQPDIVDWDVPDYTETMTLTDGDGWVRLVNNSAEIVDIAGWGGALVYENIPVNISGYLEGQSVERKALATSTADTMISGGEHQWLSNSYDSNDNNDDFLIRSIPGPQNSLSRNESLNAISPAGESLAVWHFDENGGNEANDSSGNNNNFSWGHNMWGDGRMVPERTQGKWDLGIDFNQYEEHLSFSTSTPVEFTNGATIGIWIKTDLVSSSLARFLWLGNTIIGNNPPENHLMLSVKDGKTHLSLKQQNAWTQELISSGSVNDNQWHFIVARFDPYDNIAALFVDGQKQAEDNFGLPIPALERMDIGRREYYFDPYDNNFRGAVDDAWVKTNVLTDTQINQIYQSGNPHESEIILPSLVAPETKVYYDFDDLSSSVARDSSSNGYNMSWGFNPFGGGDSVPRQTVGKWSGGVNFKKVEDLFAQNVSPVLYFPDGSTIGVWIKTTASSSVESDILWLGNGSGSSGNPNNYFGLAERNGKIKFGLSLLDGCDATISGVYCHHRPYSATSVDFINDGNWHFLTAVLDARSYNHSIKLYIDGALVDEQFFFGSIPFVEVVKAGYRKNYSLGSSYNFDGDIDDFFVLSSIITGEEVLQIYQSNQPFVLP